MPGGRAVAETVLAKYVRKSSIGVQAGARFREPMLCLEDSSDCSALFGLGCHCLSTGIMMGFFGTMWQHFIEC